jgi:GT2 family glycosyltransferase
MDLSVIIVSYNSRGHLARCLQAVLAGAERVKWEAIVVDNASHDGSPEMVAREFPYVSLIANRENVGFARACNQGFRMARGESLLFLNPDTEAKPGSIATLIGYLRDNPSLGAVGPRLCNPNGQLTRSCFRFPSLTRPLLNSRPVQLLVGERFGLAYPLEDPRVREGGTVDWLSGACLLARRQALKETGPFDERYFMYFEDTDLCRRIWRAGWQVVFWPNAEVLHVGGASSRGQWARLSIELQRSRLIYFSTHHPGLVCGVMRCIAGIASLARSLCWLATLQPQHLGTEAKILKVALARVNS